MLSPLGALDRLPETVEADRLQQIVGRLDLERVGGILLEGGDEDDLRAVLRRQGRGDAQAVLLRHLDVEQGEVGLQPLDRLGRFPAVAGGADHLGPGDVAEEDLEPLQGQRLVVDEEGAQGHATSSSAGASCTGTRRSTVKPSSWASVSTRPRGP